MFTFPDLNATDNEAVAMIDNNEPLYNYVTDRATDLVKREPATYAQRMRAIDILAHALRENVLPQVAGSFAHTVNADLIAEHYLAVACKDAEYRETIL